MVVHHLQNITYKLDFMFFQHKKYNTFRDLPHIVTSYHNIYSVCAQSTCHLRWLSKKLGVCPSVP